MAQSTSNVEVSIDSLNNKNNKIALDVGNLTQKYKVQSLLEELDDDCEEQHVDSNDSEEENSEAEEPVALTNVPLSFSNSKRKPLRQEYKSEVLFQNAHSKWLESRRANNQSV